MESSRATLSRACQEAVGRLVAERGWQLLQPDEWARRAFELLIDDRVAEPRHAVLYIYSQGLHVACSGAEGPQRQNIGYSELFRYLYDSARRRYPELAEDIAQRASERVFTRFARCHTPNAFLAFAFQQLMDSARTLRRQEQHEAPAGAPATAHRALADVPDQHRSDLAAPLIAEELRARFELLSAEFLVKHPRATQQLTALRLKYIDGLDDDTISRQLGKSIGSIYTLRARAIEKLRAEPSWRALAVEFGILPEDSQEV